MAEQKKKDLSQISAEDVARMLNEREGGRIAGRGDSPYTQEFYEKEYGLRKKKEEGKQ